MIQVQALGYEEYWAREYLCPYCEDRGMHQHSNYCSNCGKSFENVEFIVKED